MTHVQTTLAAGTDNQSFCYDEQNRLTWASSYSATGPCGIVNTGGNLTAQGAPYTASYTYDALNRLTSSPLGTYTYGDPAHLHAVTAVSNGSNSYTAAYNPVGDLTCRAPDSGATCAAPNGSKTGAGLGYNNAGQQIGWQNTQQGTPITTAHAAYDGEGRRVTSNVVSNGVTTSTTDYLVGGLEEVTTAGSTTTLTKYERVPGVCSVVIVGSGPSETISYVMTDGLGSVSEALDGNGNVTAQQLYGPYGTGRYSNGTMPTAKGYTGQYADAASSGLDYYNARYYDAAIGQFSSADTAGDGLNRYAYVADDPETNIDPTGQACTPMDGPMGAQCGVGGGGGGCKTNCGGTPPCIASCQSPCWPHCGAPKQPPSGSGSPCGGCNARQNPGGTSQNNSPTQPSPDVGAILFDLSQLVAGAGVLAIGVAALALLISNPEAFFATASLTVFFGGSPVAALVGVFATIAAGVSLLFHGIAGIASELGWVNGTAAFIISSMETVIDSVATALALASLSTTVEGAFASIGAFVVAGRAFADLFTSFGEYVNSVVNDVHTVTTCSPNQPCVIH